MKQSRRASLAESALNIAIGFGVSLIAQITFLPLLGVSIDVHQNLAFAVIMTMISLGRSYLLRRLFEALHIRRPLSRGMLAIIAERQRQIDVEGFTAEHDDKHQPGQLARAGAVYALGDHMVAHKLEAGGHVIGQVEMRGHHFWPRPWTRPVQAHPEGRRLEIAGALILAELERHDRHRRRRPS
jgi:hypothetical protein